jgi:hypothetical protein
MVLSAMAVSLVIDVWRNGPTEDMHCGRRGPSDAAMFAESTSPHYQAVKTLAAGDRPIGLLEFEDHLLDRERSWAGTGGKTLKDLGGGDQACVVGFGHAPALALAAPVDTHPV